MNIDIPTFVNEVSGRAKEIVRLAPKAAAVTLRLAKLIPEIHDAGTRHASNARFSTQGKVDLARQDLVKIAPRFGLVRAAVKRNRDAIATNRATLEKEAFSKYESDPMAAEIRAMIRAMPHGAAVQQAAKDPRILGAIVSAPELLHGVARSAIAHLVDAHLTEHHPREVAKIEAQKEAVAIAESTLATATRVFNEAGNFGVPGEFQTPGLDRFLKEHAPSAADLAAEESGGVAAGGAKISMMDSIALVMSDALMNEPA